MTPVEKIIREAYFNGYSAENGFLGAAMAVDDYITGLQAESRQRNLAMKSRLDDLNDVIAEMRSTIEGLNRYVTEIISSGSTVGGDSISTNKRVGANDSPWNNSQRDFIDLSDEHSL